MAKKTKNLKLHQVTRPEDDSKAFNLETMLNENWEKLDSAVGNLSQPVTTAEGAAIGLRVKNGRLQYKNNESWTELGLEYEDIQNLAARSDGLVTWALPQATDNTRTAIVLCRATKDISNMDYSACLSDASITKNTLAQNATSNTYTGLTNTTQYWVKAFVKYALGGKEFYSGGVTVTFTYDKPVVITEFYNAGNEFVGVTGGWVEEKSFAKPPSYFTKASDHLEISSQSNDSSGSGMYILTSNQIDFSAIKTLKFEYTFDKNMNVQPLSDIQFRSGLVEVNNDVSGIFPYFLKYENQLTKMVISLDVSTIAISKRISFSIYAPRIGIQNYGTAKIYRVWGES